MSELEELETNETTEVVGEDKTPKASDAVKAAFETAAAADKSVEDIKVAMILAGSPFKGINGLFNELMVSTGRAMNKADKASIVAGACVGKQLAKEEDFDAAVKEIMLAGKEYAVTERSAAGLVRGWAKKNNVEFYKKPKSEGEGRGRHGFKANFYDYMRANPKATEADLDTLIHDYGTKNILKDKPLYDGIRQLVNDVANGVEPEKAAEFIVPEDKRASEILDAKPVSDEVKGADDSATAEAKPATEKKVAAKKAAVKKAV